jgi:flagellar biosynthetic protein FlhB
MAEESFGGQERTEQATPQRRARSREQGRVARSPELSSAGVLLAGTIAMAMVGAPVFSRTAGRLLRETSQALAAQELGPGGLVGFTRLAGGEFLAAFSLFAAALGGLVLAVNLAQARGTISWYPVTPKFEHINPANGLKRLVGLEPLFMGAKSLMKIALISIVSYVVVSRALPGILVLSATEPADVAHVMTRLALRLALTTGLAYLLVAAFDYAYQHMRLERSLRMTRQEVFHEHKDSEGNPQVKGRLLAMARAFARRRMLQQVPTADVIVVNPTRIAVALKYDVAESPAPIVVAMGQRKLAQRIRDIAGRAGVPIVENRPVARALLATAEVGRPIPPALYAAVAEILAYVYRLRNRLSAAPVTALPRRAS